MPDKLKEKTEEMKLTIPLLVILVVALPLAGAPAADLFKTKCVMCHGTDGSGNTPMGKKLELKDLRTVTKAQPDSQLLEAIENGKGKMPGQKGRLTKDEIKSLVGYVRELAKK